MYDSKNINLRRELISHVRLCDLMDLAHQAPLSMEFSRQEYWSGQSFPSPGNLPTPRIKHESTALQAYSLPFLPMDLYHCKQILYQEVLILSVQ